MGQLAHTMTLLSKPLTLSRHRWNYWKESLVGHEKTIRQLHDAAKILYSPIDLTSDYIAGYADASFANNVDLSSQLGYIVEALGQTRHYSYNSLRIVEISACHSLSSWCGSTCIFPLSWLFSRVISWLVKYNSAQSVIHCLTDSKYLFCTIIREACTNRDLTKVAHVASRFSLGKCLPRKTLTLLRFENSWGLENSPIQQWMDYNLRKVVIGCHSIIAIGSSLALHKCSAAVI